MAEDQEMTNEEIIEDNAEDMTMEGTAPDTPSNEMDAADKLALMYESEVGLVFLDPAEYDHDTASKVIGLPPDKTSDIMIEVADPNMPDTKIPCLVAVPTESARELGIIDENGAQTSDMSYEDTATFYDNDRNRWSDMPVLINKPEKVEVETRAPFNGNDVARMIDEAGGKMMIYGTPALNKSDAVLSDDPLFPLIDSYDRAVDNIVDMLNCEYIIDPSSRLEEDFQDEHMQSDDGHNRKSKRHNENERMRKLSIPHPRNANRIKIVISDAEIERTDATAARQAKADDMLDTSNWSLSHHIHAKVSIYEEEQINGSKQWAPRYTDTGDKFMLDIPALDHNSGTFMINGSAYALQAGMLKEEKADDPAHWRFLSNGMALQYAFQDSLVNFFLDMQKAFSSIDVSNGAEVERLVDNMNLQKSFSDTFKDGGIYSKLMQRVDKGLHGVEKLVSSIRMVSEPDKKNEVSEKDRKNAIESVVRSYYYNHENRYNDKVAIYNDAIKELYKDDIANKIDMDRPPQLMDTPVDLESVLALIVDNNMRPAGNKIRATAAKTAGTYIRDDGQILIGVLPATTDNDGKNRISTNEDDIKWMPIFDNTIEDELAMQQADLEPEDTLWNHYLAMSGDVREDGQFMNDYSTVPALYKGKVVYVDPDKIEYSTVGAEAESGLGRGLTGNSTFTASARASIATLNAASAAQVVKNERGLVQDKAYSNLNKLVERAPFDGVVIENSTYRDRDGIEKPNRIVIQSDDGKKSAVIDLRELAEGEDTHILSKRPKTGLEVNMRVHAGEALTEAPAISAPMLVLFSPAGTRNYEDAVVLSQSATKKLATEFRDVQQETIYPFAGSNNKGIIMPFTPEVAEGSKFAYDKNNNPHDVSNIGPNGIIKDGATVNPGDVIAWIGRPKPGVSYSIADQQAMRRPTADTACPMPEDYEAVPIFFQGKYPGQAKSSMIPDEDGRMKLQVTVTGIRGCIEGNKVSAEGVKGKTVTMKDGEGLTVMAGPFAGYPVDVVCSDTSFMYRGALGPLMKAVASNMAMENKSYCTIPADTHYAMEDLMQRMSNDKDASYISPDGTFPVVGNYNGVEYTPDNPLYATVGVINIANINKNPRADLSDGDGKMNNSMRQNRAIAANIEKYFFAQHIGKRELRKINSYLETNNMVLVEKEPQTKTFKKTYPSKQAKQNAPAAPVVQNQNGTKASKAGGGRKI